MSDVSADIRVELYLSYNAVRCVNTNTVVRDTRAQSIRFTVQLHLHLQLQLRYGTVLYWIAH
jgi:hypothetical protein